MINFEVKNVSMTTQATELCRTITQLSSYRKLVQCKVANHHTRISLELYEYVMAW